MAEENNERKMEKTSKRLYWRGIKTGRKKKQVEKRKKG